MRRQKDKQTSIQKQPQAYLDPHKLPVRFATPDATSDSGERRITVERERVVLARRVQRVAMKIAVPLTSYYGVTVRLIPGETEEQDKVAVVLAHPDKALEIPLFEAEDDDAVVTCWKEWGAALGLPLFVEHQDGGMMPADVREGGFEQNTARVYPRRGYAFLAGRRPRFLVRRKEGFPQHPPKIWRNECEIIARD